jgi:hypothetical protein
MLELYEYMNTFKLFSSLTGANSLGEIYIRVRIWKAPLKTCFTSRHKPFLTRTGDLFCQYKQLESTMYFVGLNHTKVETIHRYMTRACLLETSV